MLSGPNIFHFFCLAFIVKYRTGISESLIEQRKRGKLMTLNELTQEQKIALAAAVEAVAVIDGRVSEGEGRKIGKIADELGDEEYRALLDEVESRFEDIDAVKEFLQSIEDQNARDLIYGTVLDEAMAEPSVDVSTSELLKWLADEWQVKVEIE